MTLGIRCDRRNQQWQTTVMTCGKWKDGQGGTRVI
jgi:hypothetical protein